MDSYTPESEVRGTSLNAIGYSGLHKLDAIGTDNDAVIQPILSLKFYLLNYVHTSYYIAIVGRGTGSCLHDIKRRADSKLATRISFQTQTRTPASIFLSQFQCQVPGPCENYAVRGL